MLAREYGWLPWQSDELDWADIVRYTEIINARNENKVKEKISEYIMQIQIAHTSEPSKLLEGLNGILTGNKIDDEVGDIEKLRAFKGKTRLGIGGRKMYGDR